MCEDMGVTLVMKRINSESALGGKLVGQRDNLQTGGCPTRFPKG